jgi:hypothetical protein
MTSNAAEVEDTGFAELSVTFAQYQVSAEMGGSPLKTVDEADRPDTVAMGVEEPHELVRLL